MAFNILLKGRDGERGRAHRVWPAWSLAGWGLRRWGGEEAEQEASSALRLRSGDDGGGGHDDGMVHLFLSEDNWRWTAGTGARRAGGRWRASWQSPVNREREAETTASGTGAQGSPRTQAEVGDVGRVRGPGPRGTWAEDREQTQRNPYENCPETTSQQPAGQTRVFGS